MGLIVIVHIVSRYKDIFMHQTVFFMSMFSFLFFLYTKCEK